MVTAASDPTRMEAESCPPGGLCDQALSLHILIINHLLG